VAKDYVPGVCNIGPAEIRIRRVIGYLGLILTVALLIVFVALHLTWPWRLTVAFPAAAGALGFLQAAFHFCAHFGMVGLVNFGTDTRSREHIFETEYRNKDRRTAIVIILGSAIVAIAVTAVAVALP